MYGWFGFLFAIIWASGAIATKIGLLSSSPLLFATIRLFLAGGLLFLFTYVIRSYPWPKRDDWKALAILGALNTTLYVGCSFLALYYVSASLFNLFITVNPFVVAIFSTIFLGRRIEKKEIIGMTVAATGLFIAMAPFFKTIGGTLFGITVLGIGMISMALGSVYFQYEKVALPHLVINTWQVIIGSIFSLPLLFLFEQTYMLVFDVYFIVGLLWQVIVVSIIGMILWFYLLQWDAVKANNFLFLTPIIGYFLAFFFLDEKITFYHLLGAFLVIGGLQLSKHRGTLTISHIVKRSLD